MIADVADDIAQANSVRLSIRLADSTGVSTSIRPGRVSNRSKTELDEKIKKPSDSTNSRKKAPTSRKAPSRGRYVDEYARPAF